MHSIKLFKCTFISLINFDFKITKILKNRYFKMIQNPQFSSLRLKIFFMRSPYRDLQNLVLVLKNIFYFLYYTCFKFRYKNLQKMPKKSLKSLAMAENISKRWRREASNVDESSLTISENDGCNKSCQTNSIRFRSVETQTYTKRSSTIDEFDFDNVSDMIDILIDSCGKWTSINNRILSVVMYLTMRLCNLQFEETRIILEKLKLLNIKCCHSWLKTINEEDDLCVLLRDNRGTYKRQLFYELYPELEFQAKSYALEKASQKKSSFVVKDLAFFINKQFNLLYHDASNQVEDKLIRSEESCRVDLKKWGAKWDKNKNRPYFEGHEREDVVIKRKEFIDYFIKNKDKYYYAHKDENNNTVFNLPLRDKRILIAHDESTFRSGEISEYRWMFPELATFFNKGKGRSIMVSSFLVQHNESDVFVLNDDEWLNAVAVYPELEVDDDALNYFPRSANAWKEPKKDNYFDNAIILRQFERLLKLIKFKKMFEVHKIEILVDNARTHTAKVYDINLMNKSAGTNCPYETIEWKNGGTTNVIHLFDNNKISKGLFVIAKELGLISQDMLSKDVKLDRLREIVSQHPAFEVTSKLEQLALEYDALIIWCPKYHCELNRRILVLSQRLCEAQ